MVTIQAIVFTEFHSRAESPIAQSTGLIAEASQGLQLLVNCKDEFDPWAGLWIPI
jgi:hypothetical protein